MSKVLRKHLRRERRIGRYAAALAAILAADPQHGAACAEMSRGGNHASKTRRPPPPTWFERDRLFHKTRAMTGAS